MAESGNPVHNEIAPGAVISGDVVLTGSVVGGIHNYHFTSGRSAPFEVPNISMAQAEEFYETARRLEFEWEVEVPFAEIRELLHAAARAGHVDAMAKYGLIVEGRLQAMLSGREADPATLDVDGALRWYTRSAHLGSPAGALYLGRIYEEHFGNPADALKWYAKAADAGVAAARSRHDGLRRRLELGLGHLAGKKAFSTASTPRTGRTPMPPRTDFDRWIATEWDNSEPKAIAFCLGQLAETCGGPHGEWGVLAEPEQVALVKHFSALHPTLITLPGVAFEYHQGIGEGNLRDFAARLLSGQVPDPHDLAPVWARQKREGRVSTTQFFYTVELTVDDFDHFTSVLDNIVDLLRAEASADPVRREYQLKIALIHQELRHRRESAVPAATGRGTWEFFPLFTPEQLQDVLALADRCATDAAAPADSQAFWARFAAALRAAPAQPFS
ncbi:tetratricopeptide repeat protein [Actinokineospora diospyrosa]|uniref:Sel1 repeat n=1 Tax=Actinokineospora diospyrosa TaxID=103728 RepID=A0ABT1I6E7_9PSEU|nr:hypothetical protein [Actinokineospora diospyrosa]MCP2268146.1 Sel1 repeat [Actinokineospora diospyrosa]